MIKIYVREVVSNCSLCNTQSKS